MILGPLPLLQSRPSVILNLRKDSTSVVVLNLDTKISMTAFCWDGCYKCVLVNDESTRAGSQVSRNGRQPTTDNLGLLTGMQKYEHFISPSHSKRSRACCGWREHLSNHLF